MLDQSMMRWTLHTDALIAIRDLCCVSCQLVYHDANPTYFIVVNPVVLANCINAIVAPKISSSDCEMVHFDVSSELEDEVKFRTIDQDEIVKARIDWRYDPNQGGPLRTFTHQQPRPKSGKCVCRLTCLRCGTRSLVLGWHLFRCSNRTRN
jgi:hypothetical protein